MYRCCCQHGKPGRNVTGRDRAPLQAGFLGTRGLSGIKVRQNRNDTVGRDLCARDSLLQTAWGSVVDPQTLSEVIAPQLFAVSLLPYLGFLYHLTRGQQQSGAPKLMVFGFYFLLVFVFATIPAGIYAKTAYQTSLANVDWLHGTAESLLTFTNLFIVIGLRQGIMSLPQDPGEDLDSTSKDTPVEDTASTR